MFILRKKKIKYGIKQTTIYVLVMIVVISVLAPYLWLIYSSLNSKSALITVPFKWNWDLTLDNYIKIFMGTSNSTTDTASQFKFAMMNSLIVSLSVTVISLLVGVIAAYSFARLNFKGKKPLFYVSLITQMIPPIALIIPFYLIMLNLEISDSKLSLILINLSLSLPFVLWIMKGYLTNIPEELEDSARIDGCTRMQSFIKIILPLAAPGLAATTIFVFIISWNEFFYAMNFTTTIASKTMPVIISEFSSKFGFDFVMASTAGVIASLPPVILSLVFQKYIISGLSSGAVKG